MNIQYSDSKIIELQNLLESKSNEFVDTLHPRARETCRKVSLYIKDVVHFNWLDGIVIHLLPTLVDRFDKKPGAMHDKRWRVLFYRTLLNLVDVINAISSKNFKSKQELT